MGDILFTYLFLGKLYEVMYYSIKKRNKIKFTFYNDKDKE